MLNPKNKKWEDTAIVEIDACWPHPVYAGAWEGKNFIISIPFDKKDGDPNFIVSMKIPAPMDPWDDVLNSFGLCKDCNDKYEKA